MALTATMYRFGIELSDVPRGVYESLDVRAALHPSESVRHMLARVLAYCLRYEEGIELCRGVSTADEPALWIKDLRGDLRAWIDVGTPSAERLHRASKRGARVYVYCHKDARLLARELEKATIHRKDELELWALPGPLLDALEVGLDRNERWTLTVSESELFLTRGDETVTGSVERISIA